MLTGIGHEKVSTPLTLVYPTLTSIHQLNILHRASARTCLILLWIHALTRAVSGYVFYGP